MGDKCKCDIRTSILGDGCEVCRPDLAQELSAPTSADVAEAVKELTSSTETPIVFSDKGLVTARAGAIRTILTALRAAQAENAAMGKRVEELEADNTMLTEQRKMLRHDLSNRVKSVRFQKARATAAEAERDALMAELDSLKTKGDKNGTSD